MVPMQFTSLSLDSKISAASSATSVPDGVTWLFLFEWLNLLNYFQTYFHHCTLRAFYPSFHNIKHFVVMPGKSLHLGTDYHADSKSG